MTEPGKNTPADPSRIAKAQQSLHSGPGFLQSVIDAIPDVMMVIDRDYRIVMANQAARRMAGDKDPAAAGLTCHELSHHRQVPCDKSGEVCPLNQVVATKAPVTLEHRHYGPGGEKLFVEITAAPIFDESGQVIQVIETCRDITERKRAETDLQKERDFTTAVLGTAGALVIVLDPDGRIVRFNRACEKLTGYSFDEVEDKYFWDLLLMPEELESVKAVFENLRAGQFPNEHENYWVTRDGSRRLISWSNNALLSEQGSVEYIIGTGIDITEPRQAEQEISRLARFPSENPNPVLRISREGTVIYNNQASRPVLEAWEYSQGKPLSGEARQTLDETWNAGQAHHSELECAGRTYLLTFTPVPDTDYVNVYGLDISERRQAREELELSHELLQIANRHSQMKPLLEEAVARIRKFTGCAAVGIRILDQRGSIPFEAYKGFTRSFYESESSLSIHTHRCMCIRVITGKIDQKLPFYTPGGSFYTGSTTELESMLPTDLKAQTRGVCREEGYESLALVPIRLGRRILGLIHIADPRREALSPKTVEALENAALQLSTAIQRVWAEEQLRQAKEQLEIRVQERTAELAEANVQLTQEVEERRRAQEAVESERKRLYAVLQMLPGYVALRSRDYRVHFANDRFLDLFGEAGDRPCYSVMRKRAKPCESCPIISVFDTGKPCDWEWTSPEGRTYHANGYPFADIDGSQLVLELGVDVTERKQLESEVLKISQLERQRIGQDLHDSLGQTLSGVSCLSGALHRKLADRSLKEAEDAAKIESLLADSVEMTRSLARGLSPVGPKPESLMMAMDELASNTARMFGITCEFRCKQPILINDSMAATHIYRIAQEAAHNAARHGKVKQVIIELARTSEAVLLTIEDDGVGLPADFTESNGMGVRIMRYRASTIGASIQFGRRPQGGTAVSCRLKQDT